MSGSTTSVPLSEPLRSDYFTPTGQDCGLLLLLPVILDFAVFTTVHNKGYLCYCCYCHSVPKSLTHCLPSLFTIIDCFVHVNNKIESQETVRMVTAYATPRRLARPRTPMKKATHNLFSDWCVIRWGSLPRRVVFTPNAAFAKTEAVRNNLSIFPPR